MTDEYPRSPKASHIAVRRTRTPVTAEAADDPITFEPVFVGPEQCDGCEPGLTVVIDGQVFVADLQGCDEDYCYYDYPTGVA
jgi:hypothetical protein